MKKNKFNHVNYLWDKKKADAIGDDQVELFLYRSNILGADLRITNFGGGNTSCKTREIWFYVFIRFLVTISWHYWDLDFLNE